MAARIELPAAHPHVALVTIDRPEKANSLDPVTLAELAAAWRRVAEDGEIRCVVLTGAGERVFCSGMDMKLTIAASQRLAAGERVSDALQEVARGECSRRQQRIPFDRDQHQHGPTHRIASEPFDGTQLAFTAIERLEHERQTGLDAIEARRNESPQTFTHLRQNGASNH